MCASFVHDNKTSTWSLALLIWKCLQQKVSCRLSHGKLFSYSYMSHMSIGYVEKELRLSSPYFLKYIRINMWHTATVFRSTPTYSAYTLCVLLIAGSKLLRITNWVLLTRNLSYPIVPRHCVSKIIPLPPCVLYPITVFTIVGFSWCQVSFSLHSIWERLHWNSIEFIHLMFTAAGVMDYFSLACCTREYSHANSDRPRSCHM